MNKNIYEREFPVEFRKKIHLYEIENVFLLAKTLLAGNLL